MSVEWISAERESASDDELLVLTLVRGEGASVSVGEVLVELEGSKSVFELRAPHDGLLYWYVQEGDSVPIGGVLACVCTEGEKRPGDPGQVWRGQLEARIDEERSRFSDSAWTLLQAEGLSPKGILPSQAFVTETDVRQYLLEVQSTRSDSPKTHERIALVGAGFGALLAYEACRTATQQIVGVFDDGSNMLDAFGVPLLGNVQDAFRPQADTIVFDSVLITIQADMATRIALHRKLSECAVPLATVIHPDARVSSLARLGSGCLIASGVIVGPLAVVGDNVFASSGVSIDHHCRLGRDTTFGPGVVLSGGVVVGAGCNFGASVAVESHVEIGSNCSIASGSLLRGNVPSNSTVKMESSVTIRNKS